MQPWTVVSLRTKSLPFSRYLSISKIKPLIVLKVLPKLGNSFQVVTSLRVARWIELGTGTTDVFQIAPVLYLPKSSRNT